MDLWKGCKNILCIRPDNMGDLIMSAPAMRALKESFNCKITVLTSSMAAPIVPFLKEIDDAIYFDAPWVKGCNHEQAFNSFNAIVHEIKEREFDGAVLFTVFSQNPLTSAMIPYLAEIPRRLAYCRENPYELLTHWVPDKEPYSGIQHQVLRDLELVKTIGATTCENKLHLNLKKNVWPDVQHKLEMIEVDLKKPWLIFHAGVSERKREYPQQLWIQTGRLALKEMNFQIILTGKSAENSSTEMIREGIGDNAFNTAGLFTMEEFITLIKRSPLVLTVNTLTAHVAAATNTPVIILYALSNPQHLPWMARGKELIFDIPKELRSRNEVLQYVDEHIHPKSVHMVNPEEIIDAIEDVLLGDSDCIIHNMIPLQSEQHFI